MNVIAYKLRHKVVIQERNTSLDEYGQQSTTWDDVKSVWAAIEPMSGEETTQHGAINFVTNYRVIMRYTKNITQKSRLRFKGDRYLRIQSIENEQMLNHNLVMMCKEVSKDEQ